MNFLFGPNENINKIYFISVIFPKVFKKDLQLSKIKKIKNLIIFLIVKCLLIKKIYIKVKI